VERDQLAAEIWSRLLPLFVTKRDLLFRRLTEHGLTPPHGMALTMLIDEPRRMRDLAELMVCDASYVTAVVDRLEELGLAVRQPSATDRRVKDIVLTARGRQVAADVQSAMSDSPVEFGVLSAADLRTLRKIVGKLDVEPARGPTWPRPAQRSA
jgi:DNA-binding MarR family transcriptional regulator